MKLIAIETATDICSVAVLDAGKLVVELTLTSPRSHAENLVPMIDDALRYGAIPPSDLSAIAVSMGPGSYTGLRIGVSTAKGLSFGTGAHLVGIPTLEALAHSAVPFATTGDLIVPVLNSRRDEVYTAAYQKATNDSIDEVQEPVALAVNDLVAFEKIGTDKNILVLGEGAPRIQHKLNEINASRVKVLDPAVHTPSASWIGRLALPRLENGTVDDPASFEPFYLKEFVAKKRKGSIFERLPF